VPAGRPSDYTIEMAEAVCLRLSCGESLRAICRDDDMPSERAVYTWLLKHEDFAQKYARAREAQMETHLEDILEIADGVDDPQNKRVRIDTRKWAMSKLAAKKYGDKHLVGSDPENPLPAPTGIDMSKLSLAALQELSKLDPDT